MGFVLEPQKEVLQERAVKGTRHKVAVCCWFTAQGRIFPRILKYEDEYGELHTVGHIRLISMDEKNYAGIVAQKYDCCAEQEGRLSRFTLLYHPDDNTWEMIV